MDAMVAAAHPPGAGVPAGVQRADLRDPRAVDRLLAGVDVVSHQAAMVGNGVDAQDLPDYASHNETGTAVLLAAMARAGVDRLVLASSMVVYGEGRYTCPTHGDVAAQARRHADLDVGVFDPRCPCCDAVLEWAPVAEDTPFRPRSGYAASKVAQEHYAGAWATLQAGRCVALRYHNVYGPDMPADTPYSGVAAVFRSALERGEGPPVFEDGAQVRDFVHVDDIAAANAAAVQRVAGHPIGVTPYNIASGRPTDIKTMAALIAAEHGGPEPVVTGRYRAADVRHVVASPAAAVAGLGFTAAVDPHQGLREFAHARLRPTS
jgi:dTDP-L-rhamnose 4-epimerase